MVDRSGKTADIGDNGVITALIVALDFREAVPTASGDPEHLRAGHQPSRNVRMYVRTYVRMPKKEEMEQKLRGTMVQITVQRFKSRPCNVS